MEKRQKKIRKGNQIMTVLATVIILLSAGISVVRYGKIDIREYENQVRIMTSEHHVQVEQGNYEPWEYPYLVCDLAGVVLYADEAFQKQEGDRVNVQETLGMDESFGKNNQGMIKKSFVLEQDDKVNADEVGELTYSFELMRDELKAKQIREEELKKAQQEMISCISHDLKTPISTVKAYAEGMRDGIARDEETRASYIRIIIEKTNLLIGMIEDLLRISNAQLNQLEICPKEVYFVSFFEKAVKEIEGYVRQQEMEFSFSIELEERLVCMDERRILEVLYNLVENSIKYRRENGKIEMIASRQGDDVLIRVLDDGIGISNDDIPYVFDKFYRAEKSRSSSIPGSGLGLSICKYIVEKHGGTIYCKSRKEKGCEIGFTLRLE